MSQDIFADGVEWRPALTPERRDNVDRHRARFASAATKFRQIRDILGLSQVEAARRLDMTQANISKMERRPTDDIAQLRKLAAGSDFEVVVMLRSKDRTIELA